MKRVAILQSNYVPWKGYFDLIASVDEFIFFDDVQYTRSDWRNRNRICTPHGAAWLTVPVRGSMQRTVREVEIAAPNWAAEHWKTLVGNYGRAPFFGAMRPLLEPLYLARPWRFLSELNTGFIEAICRFLGIRTRLSDCAVYADQVQDDRTERLVALCRRAGADCYVSGPAAMAYLDERRFAAAGIDVEWFDYAGYPEYRQLWQQPFRHDVSVLDLLFNCGTQASAHLKGLRATCG